MTNRNEIRSQLKEIVGEKNNLTGLDSLQYVQIMIAIEEKFGLRFRLKDIMSIQTFEQLTDCILGKLASQKKNKLSPEV